MKTFAIILALLAFLSLPVYADPVTAGALVTLLAPGSGALDARPATATAPLGETVITWVTLTAASTELFVTFLDRSGATISGPTAVGLGNLNPLTAVAAATPTGFMVAFDADTTATAGFRNVSFRTFNLTGGQTGSGQANVSTALDDTAPKVAGNANGEYVVAWTRMSAFGATPTAGIYMRRFTNTGTAIDPNDVRCDDPSSLNFQRQGGTAVGMWPSGKVVVAWTDGQFGATPGVNSPDGHGQGIVCRFFDNLILTPTTPVMIANSVTSDDQFEPIIAVDNRDRCLIGWCGDITPNRVDAWCRRFDDQGNALDTSDLNLTPNNATTDTFLMSIAGTPSGEWVATWQDNSNTLNEPAPRCGWARMNQNRAVFDSGVTETGGLATESHAFPRAAMDYYGNMVIAWQVRSG
ncbi:MAG: hypothetical protein CL910_09900 [Deltaproteobacteria bacterium]|nr:hypothetical protein [Deltaproteobacteria bacterium]